MQMIQYKPSQIPISKNFGMNIAGHHDILAYNSKHFVTLHSNDLWKCQKLATVHFCTEIVNVLKPISELSGSCLESLKEENTNEIMEKCSHQKLSPFKTDIKESAATNISFSLLKKIWSLLSVSLDHIDCQKLKPNSFMPMSIQNYSLKMDVQG